MCNDGDMEIDCYDDYRYDSPRLFEVLVQVIPAKRPDADHEKMLESHSVVRCCVSRDVTKRRDTATVLVINSDRRPSPSAQATTSDPYYRISNTSGTSFHLHVSFTCLDGF